MNVDPSPNLPCAPPPPSSPSPPPPTTPTAKTVSRRVSRERPSCRVCNFPTTGLHYGVFTCDSCKGFFHRSLKRHKSYRCRANRTSGFCQYIPGTKNSCQSCRFQRCLNAGMSLDAIKVGRYTTLKRNEVTLGSTVEMQNDDAMKSTTFESQKDLDLKETSDPHTTETDDIPLLSNHKGGEQHISSQPAGVLTNGDGATTSVASVFHPLESSYRLLATQFYLKTTEPSNILSLPSSVYYSLSFPSGTDSLEQQKKAGNEGSRGTNMDTKAGSEPCALLGDTSTFQRRESCHSCYSQQSSLSPGGAALWSSVSGEDERTPKQQSSGIPENGREKSDQTCPNHDNMRTAEDVTYHHPSHHSLPHHYRHRRRCYRHSKSERRTHSLPVIDVGKISHNSPHVGYLRRLLITPTSYRYTQMASIFANTDDVINRLVVADRDNFEDYTKIPKERIRQHQLRHLEMCPHCYLCDSPGKLVVMEKCQTKVPVSDSTPMICLQEAKDVLLSTEGHSDMGCSSPRQVYEACIQDFIRSMVRFARFIPGFSDLQKSEQVQLIKRSRTAMCLLTRYPFFSHDISVGVGIDWSWICKHDVEGFEDCSFKAILEFCDKLQRANIDAKEMVILKAILIMTTGYTLRINSVLADGIYRQLRKLLEYLVSRRHTNADNVVLQYTNLIEESSRLGDLRHQLRRHFRESSMEA